MIEQLDVVPGEEVAHALGGVNRCIILMQKPFPCCYFWAFGFASLQESPQGLEDEGSVDSFAPRQVVGVHHSLRVKERDHHLFGWGDADLGFYWAWGALF